MINDIDLAEIASIVRLLKELEFSEFVYSKGETSLSIRRADALALSASTAAQGVPAPVQVGNKASPPPASGSKVERKQASVASAGAASGAQKTGADAQGPGPDEVLIRAPLLGVFYPAPKPGEPNFVKIGDEVGPDSTVCIIEVMKLMNTVDAGVAGTITQIHVAEGDFVEFDQPLFTVKKSG